MENKNFPSKENPDKSEWNIKVERTKPNGQVEVIDKKYDSKTINSKLQSLFGKDNFPNLFEKPTLINIKEFMIYGVLNLGSKFQEYIARYDDEDIAYPKMLQDLKIKINITRTKDSDGKTITNFSERIAKCLNKNFSSNDSEYQLAKSLLSKIKALFTKPVKSMTSSERRQLESKITGILGTRGKKANEYSAVQRILAGGTIPSINWNHDDPNWSFIEEEVESLKPRDPEPVPEVKLTETSEDNGWTSIIDSNNEYSWTVMKKLFGDKLLLYVTTDGGSFISSIDPKDENWYLDKIYNPIYLKTGLSKEDDKKFSDAIIFDSEDETKDNTIKFESNPYPDQYRYPSLDDIEYTIKKNPEFIKTKASKSSNEDTTQKSSSIDLTKYRTLRDPKNVQILKPLFKDSDVLDYAGSKVYYKDGKVYIPNDASSIQKLITELKKSYKLFSELNIDDFKEDRIMNNFSEHINKLFASKYNPNDWVVCEYFGIYDGLTVRVQPRVKAQEAINNYDEICKKIGVSKLRSGDRPKIVYGPATKENCKKYKEDHYHKKHFSTNDSERVVRCFSNWSDVSYELRGASWLGQYKNVKMKVIEKNANSFKIRYQDGTLDKAVEILIPESYDKCTSDGVLSAIDKALNRKTTYHIW